jgi:MFS family permease
MADRSVLCYPDRSDPRSSDHGLGFRRYGYRPTMLIALVALTSFLFIQFFAVNLPMLLVGYLALGFPWGTFQTMTVSYAAEVMPIQIRPFLTTYVNLCWVIGQIICSGVNRALISNTTEWAYKIPFAVQWVWPIPIVRSFNPPLIDCPLLTLPLVYWYPACPRVPLVVDSKRTIRRRRASHYSIGQWR